MINLFFFFYFSKGEWELGNGLLRILINFRFINFQLYVNEMYLGLLYNKMVFYLNL